jgi:hypothetical protein
VSNALAQGYGRAVPAGECSSEKRCAATTASRSRRPGTFIHFLTQISDEIAAKKRSTFDTERSVVRGNDIERAATLSEQEDVSTVGANKVLYFRSGKSDSDPGIAYASRGPIAGAVQVVYGPPSVRI